MTRNPMVPIEVSLADAATPIHFFYRGQHHIATILEHWSELGAWWLGEDGREMYRVLTDDLGVFELQRDIASNQWTLYKVWD